jgi:hypothetical protein
MARVYGKRICLECGGLCHENSYRTKYGQRRVYWCSEKHLRRYQESKLMTACRNSGIIGWQTVAYSDDEWAEWKARFEPVDVITS